MEGSGSSGFDMSKMSTAEKLLAGGSVLLLIDSFLPWQSFGGELGDLGELIGVKTSWSMWQGSGSWAGVLAGLLAIALIVLGVLTMTGAMGTMNMGSMTPDKLVGWLGAGVFVFGIIKFLIVLFNEVAWGAFIGLVLLVAIGYGAWQKLQASGGLSMGGSGGGTMGGGMGGGMPPSSPPPSAPPGGMPPSDSAP